MAQISFTDLVNGVVPDASDFNTRYNALKNRINNGMEADNISAGAISTTKIVNGAVTNDKIDTMAATKLTGVVAVANGGTGSSTTANTANGVVILDANGLLTNPMLPVGSVVQVVNYQTGAVATGSTAMPAEDDTIPQITEGDKFLELKITPKSATNKLLITVVSNGWATTNYYHSSALFRNADADAIACVTNYDGGGTFTNVAYNHTEVAGTTSEITFSVRCGSVSGGFTFNGVSGNRRLGGKMASSITITEIKA